MTAGVITGRGRAAVTGLCVALLLFGLVVASLLPGQGGLAADFGQRNLPPSLTHPFGTDAMGRDMLGRVVSGLVLSLRIGLLAAGMSVVIAALMAGAAALGRWPDRAAGFVTDVMLALPHLLLLVLLSFAFGGGTGAVIWAVALSHWPRLARILRAELLQLQAAPYVEASRGFGRSRLFILRHHILPHLVPQMLVGFLLMFPHAILHEAGLTFLGFGLEPSRPAIGVMLAEAMRHLSAGRWWLGVFPGLALLAMVLAFDALGSAAERLANPKEGRN
ncbi:ABC transporter permease [Haematobacter missouriensis]|uniref:ABC transporter permease n=1 Tax=Haematobacter missouriensis TaxID=366616 RepID=A0A225CW77_9RHOB|nr:ABC transporter permease [Haematobacter missouriensis]OWJ79104.1 ABC transporter permease [Haematobacter missouriensis]OWJ81141.1 ABC transporter permease [Haematobacter missouriensis]